MPPIILLKVAAGIAISCLGAVIIGFLEIRRIGAQDGAVFDMENAVVGITDPVTPVWQMLAIGLCGVLTVLFISWDVRGKVRDGACVGTAALLGCLIVLFAYVGFSTDYVELLHQPPLQGLEGWLVKAASHPIIHTVALFALVAPLTVRYLYNRDGSDVPFLDRDDT